jgi:PPIC-type PPIASE domain
MKNILKQPLIQFLFIGAFLFSAYAFLNPDDARLSSAKQLVVSKDDIIEFMQYRSKAFKPAYFAKQLAQMPATEKKRLIDDFVREEVLYQEAKNLNLDKDDYVIKRRLVQKYEFMLNGLVKENSHITDEALNIYYEKNKSQYTIEPAICFTHVYVADKTKNPVAKRRAHELLKQLNEENVSIADALPYGDRFLYHRNYLNQSKELIQSHFGKSMGDDLFKKDKANKWQGPIQSDHGYHLVKIHRKRLARTPEISEIKSRVKQDMKYEQRQKTHKALIDNIVGRYKLIIKE